MDIRAYNIEKGKAKQMEVKMGQLVMVLLINEIKGLFN
jgi:hypothetical protein